MATEAGDTGDAGDAAWASDDVPVRSTPLEIEWETHRPAHDEPSRPAVPRVEPPPPTGPLPDDRRGIATRVVVGVAVLAVVVSIVLTATRSGDAPDAAVDPTVDPGQQEDSVPDSGSILRPPTTPVADDLEDDASEVDTVTQVDLPPSVAAIQTPTEIVMLDQQGRVATLSLPSGRVRTVQIGGEDQSNGFSSPIVVSPDATAMATSQSGIVIVPRSGPPVAVQASDLGTDIANTYLEGWYRSGDGESMFAVGVYGRQMGDPIRYAIDENGSVAELADFAQPSFGYGVTTANGRRIVHDAGGSYELAADGTAQRIDDGLVYAAQGDHLLVRRCDEVWACTIDVVTASTGERRTLDRALLPADIDELLYGATLSPDGSAVALRREASVAERVLVEFGVGETATPVDLSGWTQDATWAADSSGVFDVPVGSEGIQFAGVDGAKPVVFGEDLGRIMALGVRWPEAEIEAERTVMTAFFDASAPLETTGISLIGAGRVGGMSYIVVDAGQVQSWESGYRLGRGAATLLFGDGGIRVLPDAEVPAFETGPGGERALSDVFTVDGTKLPGPTSGTVWVPSADESRADDVVYRLLPIDASDLDAAVATVDVGGADLLGGDGRGGLVLASGGDVFVVDQAGSERLTSGELVAINADTAYVRECDDLAACAVIRLDRTAGTRSPLGAPFGVGVGLGFDGVGAGRGSALATSVSPSGDVLVTQVPAAPSDGADGGSGNATGDVWAFADTVDGRLTPIDDFDWRQPVVWSADSRFAAVLNGTSLQIYDRAAATMVDLDVPDLSAIGSAPAGWKP